MTSNITSTFNTNNHRNLTNNINVSQQLKDSLLNILPIGISLLNSEYKIVSMNPYLEKILEMTHDNLMKGLYKERRYVDSNNIQILFEQFPSTRAIKEQKIVRDIEVGVIKENGEIIWTEVTAAPVSMGDIICIITTIDITEKKKIAIALGKVTEEKEEVRKKLEIKAKELVIIAEDTKKMNEAMIGRELKMIDLKAENELLKSKLTNNTS